MQTGKVAIVTGSGRGIGAATAKLLAANGYAVCISYKADEESAVSIEHSIRQMGGRCISVKADVSSENEVRELFERVDEELGALSCLVNNVGILAKQCRLEDMSTARIEKIFKTNVTSYFMCSQQALKRMSKQRGGSGGAIINVSSLASITGY